jgi:hypothetical protein
MNLAYFKIGGKVWKAKYADLLINLFSCSINRKFIKENYNKFIKTCLY